MIDDFICDDMIRAAETNAKRTEREFWAKKFRYWAKCQEHGSSTDHLKARGFADCARVLEQNDRWFPAGADE